MVTAAQGAIQGTEYARHTHDLIRLITELRAIGAQSTFDLPRIVVIGNQSAGKSSLVEAISGITVPRSSGTCTRCPFECRLEESESDWRAQVRLRRESETDEISFGPPVGSPVELEPLLRRAQLAILNPSIPISRFLEADLDEDGRPIDLDLDLNNGFSKDVVCVDVSGRGLTNLAFCDLPGIISSVADDRDRPNIDLIENLVKANIQDNTIILLTLTMRDDLENQKAAMLAREVDPDGDRTIGVLTKPDLIQPDEEAFWLSVLRNEQVPLQYGYFITKQPSQSELLAGLSGTTAERDRAFFGIKTPWSSCDDDIKSRMGVEKLTTRLSKLLLRRIYETLPKLHKDADNALEETLSALSRLPPAPTDEPISELLELLQSYTSAFTNFVSASESYESLIQACNPAYKRFQQAIRATAPKFFPWKKDSGGDVTLQREVLEFAIGEFKVGWDGNMDGAFYVDEMEEHIDSCMTRQLPGNVPYSAKTQLMSHFCRTWKRLCKECFDMVFSATVEKLAELTSEIFGGRGHMPLDARVQRIVLAVIERKREATLDTIDSLVAIEDPPHTMNSFYMENYKVLYLTNYRRARAVHEKGAELAAQMPTGHSETDIFTRAMFPATSTWHGPEAARKTAAMEEALAALAKCGFTDLKAVDLDKLHEVDQSERELQVMAEVRAWFQIASQRIVDNLTRIIDHHFLRSLAKSLQVDLINGLQLGGENSLEKARSYLAEDPSVAERRVELSRKKVMVDRALDKLRDFVW